MDVWWLIATFFSFEDLTRHLVCDYAAIEHLMQQGNTHRYFIGKYRLSYQIPDQSAFCTSIEKESTNAPLYTSWVLKDFRKYRICRSQEWGHFMKVSFPGHILKVTSTVLHVSVLFIKLNYMLAPQSCIGVYYKQHDYSLPYTLNILCHFNFKLLVFFEIFPIFLFFVYCECRMD